MPHLFSPLRIGRVTLQNRIVMASLPSGHAAADGCISADMHNYYVAHARSGIGMILLEESWFAAPVQAATPHLALYHDDQIPALQQLTYAVQACGSRCVPVLNQPAAGPADAEPLEQLTAAYRAATARIAAAGCDGVIISAADYGPLHQYLSPLLNPGDPGQPLTLRDRLRLPLAVVEAVRAVLAPGTVLGFRLRLEELVHGGLSLQDTRVLAKRLTATGVNLLDIAVYDDGTIPIARFPGWQVPLVTAVKSLIEAPVMVGDGLDDALLADSLIHDGSVDLIALGEVLQRESAWVSMARAMLEAAGSE